MKVANDNIVRLQGLGKGSSDGAAHRPAGGVYAAQRRDHEQEHDGRGLAMAVLLCVVCWGALGYFLLG